MTRIVYDNSKYHEEKSKLPKPDGIHCIICSAPLPPRKRKYCSDSCFREWHAKIEIQDWNEIKSIVLKRDKYTCQNCDFKSYKTGELHVHHIVPIANGGNEFKVSNCITLCTECHKKAHVSVYSKSPISKSILAGTQKTLEDSN